MSTPPTAKAPATAPARSPYYLSPTQTYGPWPSYAMWGRRWPVTGRPAGGAAVAAVAAAAVIAALALPLDRGGVGWLITALAGTAALIVARAFPDRPSPGAPPPLVIRSAPGPAVDRFGWAAATVALLAVGTFRSAGWLFLLCLATATLTGALALTGGHSMRSIAVGYTMPVIAAFRAVPWLTRGATKVRRPPAISQPPVMGMPLATGQPPAAYQPPAPGQPPAADKPSAVSRPSSAASQPSTASQPSATSQPPAPGQPSATSQPPAPGQPSATSQPPAASRPSTASQPPAASQPGGTSRPPIVSQPSPAGRPLSPSRPNAVSQPPAAGPNIRIVATIAVSVALLTVFGALFVSADAAFAEALSSIVPDMNMATVVRWIFIFGLAGMIIGGAAFLRVNPPDLSGLDATEGRKVSRLEWAIPLGLLVALFAAFVAVQLTVLFGGNRHVLGTDGLTYAEYARGGFWQLSFVTGLTLVVLGGAARWAPRETAADRTLIRVILGALAGLTLVIVASALQRMNLYADTYGLTRLRLLVACCEAWFGLVLILVLAAGVRIRAAWLPRVAIAAGVAALLGLAAANPDGLIASYNIRQDRTIDVRYLSNLSPDAVPALTGLDPLQRECVLGHIRQRLDRYPDDWRGWNLGRERARDTIDDYVTGPGGRCA